MNRERDVLWDIRDARGLSIYEKWFLGVLASRGPKGMYTSRRRMAQDMGCGTTSVDTAARSLLAKGIVTVKERPGYANLYKLNRAKLSRYIPNEDHATREPPPARREPRVTPHVNPPHATRDLSINRKSRTLKRSSNPKTPGHDDTAELQAKVREKFSKLPIARHPRDEDDLTRLKANIDRARHSRPLPRLTTPDRPRLDFDGRYGD